MAMGMGGGGGGGGGAMSAAPAAMSAAMSGGGNQMSAAMSGGNAMSGNGGGQMSAAMSGGNSAMSGGGAISSGMGMGGNRPAAPQPRSFAEEMAAISQYSAQNADAQANAAIRTNDAFQDQAQESTQDIARNLDNDYTRAARQNLAGAQAGVDQVNAAATGIGQLRDQYAAQGQDPAMRRLNDMALGQLYRPDQIRAGQVAADQVQGASVADIGAMQSARADLADPVRGASAASAYMTPVNDVQGPAGYTADQVRARNIRAAQAGAVADVQAQQGQAARMQRVADVQAAQAGAVADVQGASVGGFERIGGTQVSSVDPMQAARIARTQGVSTQNIRASAAERALMDEVRGNGLLGQLQSQASADLALGGSLSAEQSRDAAQSARAGMAARGLGVGNSALAAEMLNRDRFASQRDTERRAFAGQVLGQATGLQQAANQAYMGRMEGNRGRELQAGLANQSVDANRAIQQAQLRQQANLTTNQNEQQRVLAEAGYAQQAALSNQDFGFRSASQDAQFAQQAALANQSAGLQLGQTNAQLAQQAALANQQTQANRAQFNAANQQQMTLANQDAALRASLANQSAGLTLGQSNAQLLQQARLANQSAGLQAQQANQAANARAAEFQQQTGLQAALANQQTAFETGRFNAANEQAASLQNAQMRQQAALANQAAFNQTSQFNAGLSQQANAATFESAQQRAMANAGYAQQAALSNQDANLRAAQYNVGQDMAAQQANQQANQTQEQYNRAFLGQVAGMNFDQNQARTSMLSGLYGQQAGLGQTTASLQQGMAQSQVALDPYQRALGSNMPIATIAPSSGLIGQAYGQTMNYGSDLFNTNTNMQASMYNTWANNKAGLQAARIGGASGLGAWGTVAEVGGTVVGAALKAYTGCWVARAAWGEDNPRWIEFRESMLAHAPEWFVEFYLTHGPSIAKHINTPLRRAITRNILTTLQNLWTPKTQLQLA